MNWNAGLGDLTRACHAAEERREESKNDLIRRINLMSDGKPLYILRYACFDDYVDFVIRNSNMDRANAEWFVKHYCKEKYWLKHY